MTNELIADGIYRVSGMETSLKNGAWVSDAGTYLVTDQTKLADIPEARPGDIAFTAGYGHIWQLDVDSTTWVELPKTAAGTAASQAAASATAAAGSASAAAASASQAQTVAASIPADYTSLSNSVVDLKSAFGTGKNPISYSIVENSYPKDDGSFGTQSGWNRTDYIPVTPGQRLYVDCSVYSDSNAWYDSSKNVIGELFGIKIRHPAILDVPDGAAYLIISNDAANWFSEVYSMYDYYAPSSDTSNEFENVKSALIYGTDTELSFKWEYGNIDTNGDEDHNDSEMYARTVGYYIPKKDCVVTISQTDGTSNLICEFNSNGTLNNRVGTLLASTPVKYTLRPKYKYRFCFNGDNNTNPLNLDNMQSHIKITASGYDTQDEAAQAIADKVTQAISGQDIVFVHITDSHVGTAAMTPERAAEHFRRAMFTAKAVNADFLIHTGDMIQGEGSTTGTDDKQRYHAYMGEAGSFTLPMLWCQGNANHDFGVKTSSDPLTYALNRDIANSFTGRFGKWFGVNAVYNANDTVHTYYYIDNDFIGCRIIVLDADDYGTLRRGWGFSDQQITWFGATLTAAKAKGYPVLIFAHMPPTNNLMPTESGTPYQIEASGGAGILNALSAFTSGGGTVLAYIYGHVHWDNYYNDTSNGVKYISCTCDLPVQENVQQYAPIWGSAVAPARTIGTATEYAFDVYVVNKNTGAIKTFRYGAGSDRTFS